METQSGDADVIVIGGGIAGVAAALSVWGFKMPQVAAAIAAGVSRTCSSTAEYVCALAPPACGSGSI